MAILGVIQNATKALGVEVPSAVYGQNDRELVELAYLANDAKDQIVEGHDWATLKRIHEIAGDGTTAAFDLPADFGRFPKHQHVWSTRLESPLEHVADQDRWLELTMKDYSTVVGVWTHYGGQLHFIPTPASTETLKFFYISNRVVRPVGSVAPSTDTVDFAADTDTFRLDDRLLELGIIWRWRMLKGLPYAEDMQNYEVARAHLVQRDKPAKVIAVGSPRMPRGVDLAYPRNVG